VKTRFLPKPYLVAMIMLMTALAIILAMLLFPGTFLGRQCESLRECIQYANTHGTYKAIYRDSYSSPGGTATIKKTYTVANDQVTGCISCIQIFTSGYGNSTADCQQGWNCSDVMKQTDVLGIVRNMNVSAEFRLGERQCFQGTTASDFEAVVCFDETNRIVNYAEQGKRPFYTFSIAGYETEIRF
jgi:hypothetical protein